MPVIIEVGDLYELVRLCTKANVPEENKVVDRIWLEVKIVVVAEVPCHVAGSLSVLIAARLPCVSLYSWYNSNNATT